MQGTFNLLKIPQTVTYLSLATNNLVDIGDFSNLRGKALQYLNIGNNPALKLDFSLFSLENNREPLPLEGLTVSWNQISHIFGSKRRFVPDAYNAIKDWIQTSTLNDLWVKRERDSKRLIQTRYTEYHKRPTGSEQMRSPDYVLRPITTHPSRRLFQDLLRMMEGVQYGKSKLTKPMEFIHECARSGQCSSRDLCVECPFLFDCDKRDKYELITITILRHGQRVFGEFDLSAVPNSVTKLSLCVNKLSSVGSLNGLKGKSLEYLDIHTNSLELSIDLSPLTNKRDPLPLKFLFVSFQQIRSCFNLDEAATDTNSIDIINKWMQTSTLDQMIVNIQKESWIFNKENLADTHFSHRPIQELDRNMCR